MVVLRSRIKSPLKAGFTLVELSIVLVIIGLIIGGVLVGRDLISAATVRAQISQIEKYNAAVNTFRGKYGYLPGDLPEPYATQYGFMARSQAAGCPAGGLWDGNGIIEGNNTTPCNNPSDHSGDIFLGETLTFWMDLSSANLISESFTYANAANGYACHTTQFSLCFPPAKIGRSNFVYAWSGGVAGGDGNNYFGVSEVTSLQIGGNYMYSNPGITVQEAYNIDKKIDDGLPQSGRVTALYLNALVNFSGLPVWAGGGLPPGTAAYTTATPWAATNCYDNNGSAGIQQYSMENNGGNNNANIINCALSVQFQ